jgi:NADH-quinone oxidoreductase subunit E
MLSEAEIEEIESAFKGYKNKQAACVEALKIVQRRHGWISDDDIKNISALLGMSPDELDGVATFYSLIFRKPVGRHVILICDSVSCWITGYEGVLDHIKRMLSIDLGGTTADGRFTLLPIACIGACDQAPAMLIDDNLYGNLDEDKIVEILAKYE